MLKQLFLEHRTIRRYQSRRLLTPTSYNTLIIYFYSSKAKALCIVLIQAYFAFLCIIGVSVLVAGTIYLKSIEMRNQYESKIK